MMQLTLYFGNHWYSRAGRMSTGTLLSQELDTY